MQFMNKVIEGSRSSLLLTGFGRILQTLLAHVAGGVEPHEAAVDAPDYALAALVQQQHIFEVGSVDATGVDDISLLDHLPCLIVEIHENGGSFISNQTLGDDILLSAETSLLVHHDEYTLHVVLFLSQLAQFVRGGAVPPNQGVGLRKGPCQR